MRNPGSNSDFAGVAQAKDSIPVNPKLLVTPPEGAVVLFGGKPEQMRDNW